MKKIFSTKTLPLCVIFISAFLGACSYDYIEFKEPEGTIHFSTQIEPIFTDNDNCTACHKSGGTAPDLTQGNAYNSIIQMNLVNTSDPPSSPLYVYPDPSNTGQHSWKKYTPNQASLVLTWIQQGALDN